MTQDELQTILISQCRYHAKRWGLTEQTERLERAVKLRTNGEITAVRLARVIKEVWEAVTDAETKVRHGV